MSIAGTFRAMRMFAPALGRLPLGHLWFLLRKVRNEKPHRLGGQVRINTFFPPCPSPAFDRFLAAVIARRRVPFTTYMAVTSDCPFRCPHCSYGRRPRANPPTRQLLDILEQARSVGTCTLGFTGGEPLLREDVEELVAAASSAGRGGSSSAGLAGTGPMATVLFTTGRGLNASRATRLAEAGLCRLTVGIESADPASHDHVRGVSGSFAEGRRAVQISKDAGLYTALSTVGTREKMASGDLERLYDLAWEWGVGELGVLSPVATGSAASCGTFMLTEQERRMLYDFHVAHNRRAGGPAVACFAYLESADMFGCGAGYHHLFIDAAGEVCPCDLTPLSLGNVTREPLADIWERMGGLFARPRRSCLMADIASKLDLPPGGPVKEFPLSRSQSEWMCSNCAGGQALPEGYSRLFPREKLQPKTITSAVAAAPTTKHSA